MSMQFTVRGKGDFPLDMLRHDQCYPLDAEGVEAMAEVKRIPSKVKITPMHGERTPVKPRMVQVARDIVLGSSYQRAPTIGRWESFGWRVVG